jgi:hypothetical protein
VVIKSLAAKKAAPTRKAKAIRKRKLRDDANIEKALDTIAKDLGLPRDSISVRYKNGRKVRADNTVENLRDHWKD